MNAAPRAREAAPTVASPEPEKKKAAPLPYRMPAQTGATTRKSPGPDVTRPSYVDEDGVPARPPGFTVEVRPEERRRPEAAPRGDEAPGQVANAAGFTAADAVDLVTGPAAALFGVLRRPLLVIFGTIALSVSLWVAIAWSASGKVRVAAAAARTAETAFYAELDRDEPHVAADLAELGATGPGLDALFADYQRSTEPAARLLAAGRLLEELDNEATDRAKNAPPTVVYKVAGIQQKLATIHALSNKHQQAMVAWEHAADEPGAGMGISLGFAPAPY